MNICNTKSVLNVSPRGFSQNFKQQNLLNVNIYLLLVENLGDTYFCMHQDGFPENHAFVTHFLRKHHHIVWFLSWPASLKCAEHTRFRVAPRIYASLVHLLDFPYRVKHIERVYPNYERGNGEKSLGMTLQSCGPV